METVFTVTFLTLVLTMVAVLFSGPSDNFVGVAGMNYGNHSADYRRWD